MKVGGVNHSLTIMNRDKGSNTTRTTTTTAMNPECDELTVQSDLTPTSNAKSADVRNNVRNALSNIFDRGRSWKDEERERMEAELLRHLTSLERRKNEEIAELQVKVAGRDSALASLERTVEMQGHTVQMLRSELEDVRGERGEDEDRLRTRADDLAAENENLRGKVDRAEGRHEAEMRELRERHQMALEEVQEDADTMRRKVHEKKKVILKQNRQMMEFQKYITELTDELERLYREADEADGGGTLATTATEAHRRELERRLQIWENGSGSCT